MDDVFENIEDDDIVNVAEVMDCGEVCCEYCSKDRCIYMTYKGTEE